MGYKKLVESEDERQAATAGFRTKLLTQLDVAKQLGEFGVDPESTRAEGMKARFVLTSAMWHNPHVLILDELMNYLDREGLGALILVINDSRLHF